MKQLSLTFGERHVVNNLFGSLSKVDLATAKTVRRIRDRLELREVRKEVENLLEDYGGGLTWDLIVDHEDEDEDGNREPRTFTLDDSDIDFLLQSLREKNWNEMLLQDSSGQSHKVEVWIPPAQIDAIAGLAESLETAVPIN